MSDQNNVSNNEFNEKDKQLEEQYNSNDIGKKIIYCPNEWQDPLFGWIIGTDRVTAGNSLMVKVKNALTDEIVLVHPESFFYTDEMFTLAILKLNPFERWNMKVAKLYYSNLMWTERYRKESISDKQELDYALRKSGFLFKNNRTSLWLDSNINGRNNQWTQNFHKYKYSFTHEGQDTFTIHVYYNDEQIFELQLDGVQELKEFEDMIGRDRFEQYTCDDVRVFDWAKAARIIKDRNPETMDAGLLEDWPATSETIYENFSPVLDSGDGYLASKWATPVLKIDDTYIECYIYANKTPGWYSKTWWPKEALDIINKPFVNRRK